MTKILFTFVRYDYGNPVDITKTIDLYIVLKKNTDQSTKLLEHIKTKDVAFAPTFGMKQYPFFCAYVHIDTYEDSGFAFGGYKTFYMHL